MARSKLSLILIHVALVAMVPGLDRDSTGSFGVAVLPEHAGTAEALLRLADRALYAAKGAGRNRVVLVDEHAAPVV
jgi:GGDEF domain-containing protein